MVTVTAQTSNRTILELKFGDQKFDGIYKQPSNRTILELKFGFQKNDPSSLHSSNRTILELKPRLLLNFFA